MRSLFIKIFLWFWVAMALVGIASLVSAVATESHPFFAIRWFRFLRTHLETQIKPENASSTQLWIKVAGNVIRLSGQTAITIYEQEGEAALGNYVSRLEQTVPIQFFLLNANGNPIIEEDVPQEVQDMARQPSRSGFEFKRTDDSAFLLQHVPGTGNREYTVAASFPLRHFMHHEPALPIMHLLVILVTAGGVCYWLARYISTPISRLGAAARRLADGDLKVRVGAAVGNRRDEISDLARDFDGMAERIESLMTAQRRLLRDISHEFRSPLTRLGIALEIARNRGGQEAARAMERIDRETGRLNDMISRLLTLSRLEAGIDRIENKPVDLPGLLEEIVTDADFEAQNRGCSVRIISKEDYVIPGTSELLRSAIENVVRNAIRYTSKGSEVEVALRRGSNARSGAVITVRDFGPGVPEEALGDLFYPFYRVGDARDRKEGGTGLGLAITERAVKLHGGTVRAANSPEGGLIVTIELPVNS